MSKSNYRWTVRSYALPNIVQSCFSLSLPVGHRLLSVLRRGKRIGGSRLFVLEEPGRPLEEVKFFMCSTGSKFDHHDPATLEHVASWLVDADGLDRTRDAEVYEGFIWHLFRVLPEDVKS